MSEKKILSVLAGETVWPPPIWLMRQAGRYLPEYRAIKDNSGGFLERCTTPDIATEITIQPIRRFAMDAAILFSDILVLPWAMGQDVKFIESVGPVLAPIRSQADVDALSDARAEAYAAPVMQTVRQVRAALPGHCTLLGFAGSPFTVACYMVEGGGSRDFVTTREMAYESPSLFDSLMERVTTATIAYLSAQIEAGAEAVMLFDTWSGMLPPSEFERHVIKPTATIVAALKEQYAGIKVLGFPRLAGIYAGHYAKRTGVDCVGLDTGTDPALAAASVPAGVAIQGNLDPISLLAGGETMTRQADGILEALRGRPHIFNLGHGIVPQTPPAHVGDLVAYVRAKA